MLLACLPALLTFALCGFQRPAFRLPDTANVRLLTAPAACNDPRSCGQTARCGDRESGGQLLQRVALAAGDLAGDVLHALQGKYADRRPLKVHSTLVLGLENGHRKKIVLRQLQRLLSEREYDLACQILDEENYRFEELLQRRYRIAESASREMIPELLDYNDIAAQLLTKKLHDQIMTVILNRRRALRFTELHSTEGSRQ
jgi:hypothetical protein